MRMKIIYNCVIVILTIHIIVTPTFSQQSVIDSLRLVFVAENNSEKKIAIYNNIAHEVLEMNLEKAIPYADTLERMATQYNSKIAKANALYLRL